MNFIVIINADKLLAMLLADSMFKTYVPKTD